MATSDVTDSPTSSSAGATTAPTQAAAPDPAAPPPSQARPVHDDLPADQPVVAGPERMAVLEQSVVEELVAASTQAPEFERPAVAGGHVPASTSAEVGHGRGTPLQALAGWGGALVLGAACWAGALAVVGRVV